MRVLHIFNSHRHGGGSDDSWANTIRLSRAKGFDVEIFSRSSKALSPSLADKVRAAVSGIHAPATVHEAAEVAERFRPDLVHTHELYPLISPFVLPRIMRLGIPIVHSCYDFRLTCPVATHFNHGQVCHRCVGGREYRAVLDNCRDNRAESIAYAVRNAVARKFDLFRANVSGFIVPSAFSRDWLERDVAIDPARITIVPCVIETPSSPADPALGEYIAYAGRFVPEKGVELLIEAARRTGLPVRLAGNQENHPAIRPGDPVSCVLTPSRDDLVRFYRGARFLVVPSLWYETFGIVAAEAMGNGIPVLAARLGALPTTILDGVTGLMFEPRSIDDLAATMLRLWNSPDLCRRLGQAGHDHVRTRFNEDVHMRNIETAYAQAIATRLPRP